MTMKDAMIHLHPARLALFGMVSSPFSISFLGHIHMDLSLLLGRR